jgi:hypothetical protein
MIMDTDKRKNDDDSPRRPWLSYLLVVCLVLVAVVMILGLMGPTMCGGVFSNISRGLAR